MAKSKHKVSNKPVHSSSNDVSTSDYNNALTPLVSSTGNSVVNTANMIVTDNIEDQVYPGRSAVGNMRQRLVQIKRDVIFVKFVSIFNKLLTRSKACFC